MTRPPEHQRKDARSGSGSAGLRIACVIDDLGTGGAQRIITLMARELASRPVELVVISLGQRDDERDTLLASGISVHEAPAGSLASPRRALRLIRLLRAIKPDLVHTHLLAAHALGGIAARSLGIPVISTLHNVDPHPRFAGTWKRHAESLCLRFLSRRVIAVGPRVAETNAARLGGRHIDVLPNPLSVSTGRFADSETELQLRHEAARAQIGAMIDIEPSTRLLLMVGRLASEKGWPDMLDVVDALRNSHPDFKLLCVGDGPRLHDVAQAIEARGLGRHVHLLGRRDDVEMFYRGCDLFVLNSSIEGLPMALLEAMANGLPVVATRVGDVEHAASDEVATLVDAGRPEAMVDGLRQVLDRPDDAHRRAMLGRDHVLQTFDAARWTDGLLELFRMARGGPGLDRLASAPTSARADAQPNAIAGRPDESRTAPIRVVEFVDGIKTGGAQELMVLRARHARRMNYAIHIISLAEQVQENLVLEDLVEGVHSFASPHVFDTGRLTAIIRLLRELQPDVILTHLRTSNIVGALCGRLLRVPVVSTLHITFPELGLAHARRDWAEKWALRLAATHVVAVGPSVAQTHRGRFGSKRIEIVPNPVELPLDRLTPSERRAHARAALDLPFDPQGTRIVLSVGRLTHVKGVLESVGVIERLLPTMPDLRFVIVGDGAADAELRQRIDASDLQDRIFMLGRSESVRTWMAASNVLLQNSYAEGLPLVLLEGMSMQLPVVATGVGDVPWLLADGECGTLIEPGDEGGTAQAIQRVLDAPDEAAGRAHSAYLRVREAFSVDRWLADIDRLIRGSMRSGDTAPRGGTVLRSTASSYQDEKGRSDPIATHD